MSVFGPNQREEVIIGNAVAAETTLATFLASASDQEIKILSADGTAPAAGEDFKVYQKTAGTAPLNYEVSDIVKADKVEEVILATYSAETLKSVTVTVDSATANTTYVVEVYVLEDGGSLSPENFNLIQGVWVTDDTAGTVTEIRDGLLASLQYAITKRGDSPVSATSNSTDEIVIAGVSQPVVLGKKSGKATEFNVNAKSFLNTAINKTNAGDLSAAVTAENDPGAGTGKYAVNLEWFCKGYGHEVYRQTGYPADFPATYYASESGVYNVIHIKYYDDRQSPTVEKQKKVLTILVDKGTDTLGNNAQTNAVLDDLQLILGAANVPADLPTV